MSNFISFNDYKSKIIARDIPKLNQTISQQNKVTNKSDEISLSNKLKEAKDKNGIIEKIADKIKNITGIGFTSKKIQAEIDNNQDENKINSDIKNYRRQQEGIAQAGADVISGLAAMTAYFKIKDKIRTTTSGIFTLNKDFIDNFLKDLGEGKLKNFANKIVPILDKKSTAVTAGAVSAAVIGGFIKSNLLKLNRISSKEFKLKKNDNLSKEELKTEKKKLRKEKKNANFRNKVSGAINGLTAPLIPLFGPLGAIAYTGINSLSRYFIAQRTDKGEKSFTSYIKNLKNSPVTNISSALLLAIPALKSGKADRIFEKNLEKVIEKLKDAKLEDKYSNKSIYSKLEDILFSDDAIKEIIEDNTSVSERIQKLSDENIFALKFKQIGSNNDELAKALKQECPPTRTLEEAREFIGKTFGDKYEVEGCVGVGTVAESYLAKDESGKLVVIKMIKKGITNDKVIEDKNAFIKIINSRADIDTKEKEVLVKNIESIAEGVLQELNLENEKTAAEALKKATQKAKIVVPIEVKDGIYVMEKADGISLQNLMKYLKYQQDKDFYSKLSKTSNDSWHARKLSKTENELAEFINSCHARKLSKTENELAEFIKLNPGLEDIGDISLEEAKKLVDKYNEVLIEQFSKVGENGKTIHADIHPGNIFIDINAMRKGEGNFFTLIDTGNVINQTPENAIRFLNLSSYIQNADIDNITKFVLDGAKLPDGMTEEKAFELISEEFKKAFFDNETKLDIVTNDSVVNLASSIMQKFNIIPGDTQGNLLKAKTSAEQSKTEFYKAFFNEIIKKIESSAENGEANKSEIIASGLSSCKDIAAIGIKEKLKTMIQEKLNLSKISPALRASIKKSANAPAENSEEFLTYKLKPFIASTPEDMLKARFSKSDF